MKRKTLLNLFSSIFLFIVGIVLLLIPKTTEVNIKYVFLAIMSVYAIIKYSEFFVTFDKKDMESLFEAITCTIVGIPGVLVKSTNTPMIISISLIVFVSLMSIINFKKVDYLMDKKDKMWIPKMITFLLLILTGILCGVNLYFSSAVQTLVLGFFFFINGLLELVDPLLRLYLDYLKKD